MISSCFVRSFIEAADQVFEHQSHGDVVNISRMQVNLGELCDHLAEAIGLFKLLNLFAELKALKDLADVLGEATYVIL